MGDGFPPDPWVMTSLGFQGANFDMIEGLLGNLYCIWTGVYGSCPDDSSVGGGNYMFS